MLIYILITVKPRVKDKLYFDKSHKPTVHPQIDPLQLRQLPFSVKPKHFT